jgi:acylphosphatase
MLKAHLFVEGKVQGVFFRQETAKHARAAGVNGWVRNLPDGRVEALFEGDEKAVESLIEWCHTGPPSAVVRRVIVTCEDGISSQYSSFSAKY